MLARPPFCPLPSRGSSPNAGGAAGAASGAASLSGMAWEDTTTAANPENNEFVINKGEN